MKNFKLPIIIIIVLLFGNLASSGIENFSHKLTFGEVGYREAVDEGDFELGTSNSGKTETTNNTNSNIAEKEDIDPYLARISNLEKVKITNDSDFLEEEEENVIVGSKSNNNIITSLNKNSVSFARWVNLSIVRTKNKTASLIGLFGNEAVRVKSNFDKEGLKNIALVVNEAGDITLNKGEQFALNFYRTVNLIFKKPTDTTVIVQKEETPTETEVIEKEPEPKEIVKEVTQPITQTTVVQPIQERVIQTTVERVVSGVTLADLQTLSNELKSEIYRVSSESTTQSNNNYQAIALTNKIDNLSSVTINNSTITGGTITGATFGGSTLSLTGTVTAGSGTFSGGISGTTGSFSSNLSTSGQLTVSGTATSTMAGDFAFDTNTLYVDSVNNRVGIGSTSPSDTLAVNGPVYIAPISVPSNTTDRLYNLSNNLYWGNVLLGGAAVGHWTLDGSNVYRATGNVGVGTTSPTYNFSVEGSSSLGNQARAGYFTATSTTATSTFPYLASTQSDVGTVVEGTWNGDVVGEVYGGTGQTTYVAGDILYSDSSNSLARLPRGANGQILKLNNGLPSWGTDMTGSGNSVSYWATTTDSLAVYPTDTSNVVVVGSNATTSTGYIFEVSGNSLIPYASSTQLTVSGNSYLATVSSGIWNGTAIGDAYLTKTGDWTGTFDGQEGSYYLNASNLTDFGSPFYTYFNATNTDALSEGSSNLYYTPNRVASVIAGTTTDALAEGLVNYYWTDNRFDVRLTATTTLPKITTLAGLSITESQVSDLTHYTDSDTASYINASTTILNNNTESALESFITGVTNIFTNNDIIGDSNVADDITASNYLALTNWFATTTHALISSLPSLTITESQVSDLSHYTDNDWDIRMTSTTTLPKLTTLLGLTNASSTQLTTTDSTWLATNGGNVGIGTTSPLTKLSVQATAGSPALDIASSTGASMFYVSESGNVGIGTTTPGTKFDVYNGQIALTGSLTLSGTIDTALNSSQTITNNTGLGISAIKVRPTFNGDGNSPFGLDIAPTFSPSSSITSAKGFNAVATAAPGSGVTITTLESGVLNVIYNDTAGSVTDSKSLKINTPVKNGSLVATNHYGLHMANQGLAGMTNSYGIYVDNQSGATNSYSAIFEGGNVGIGTTTPSNKLTVDGTTEIGDGNTLLVGHGTSQTTVDADFGIQVLGTGYDDSGIAAVRYSDNFGGSNILVGKSRSTTIGGLGALSNNDNIGGLLFVGDDGTGLVSSSAIIKAQVDGLVGTGDLPSRLVFFTTPDGSITSEERLRIDNAGNIGIGTTTPSYKLSVGGFINLDGTIGGYKIDGNTILQASSTNFSTLVGQDSGKNLLSDGTNNTAIGYQSLYSNTSGRGNNAFGYQPLYSNTTGNHNIAIGHSSLYSNTTGEFNIALSANSLSDNTTGSFNTAIGIATSRYNMSATSTVAIGYQSGRGVEGQSYNQNGVFLGYQAGYGLTTGDNNLLLGYGAGDNLTTGDSNIVIGYDIDSPTATNSNTMTIGNLIYGTGIDGTGTTLSSGNVGIGTTTPYAKLSVTNTGSAPSFLVEDSTSPDPTPFIITSGGAVGVGTSSPVDLLSVQGGLTTTSSVNFARYLSTGSASMELGKDRTDNGFSYIDLHGDTTYSDYGLRIIRMNTGANADSEILHRGTGTLRFKVGEAGDMEFLTNNLERMNILSGGNVGIGTTTPFGKLAVENTGSGLSFVVNDEVSDASPFVVDASGKVGIGTNSPSRFLHSYGPEAIIRLQDDDDASSYFDIDDASSGRVVLDKVTSSGVSIIDINPTPSDGISDASIRLFRSTNTTGEKTLRLMKGDGTSVIQVQIASDGSTTYFNGGGNVGIGTTSPLTKLSVQATAGSPALDIASSTGASMFYVSESGNVGIGTNSPTSKLEVVGDIVSKGTSWSSASASSADTWNNVTYGNGLFVAVSAGGGVMSSPDGINWTDRTAASASVWNSVTYGNGLFVAVALNGNVMTSSDGVTWTSRTPPAYYAWKSVTYGNNTFVAVSSSGAGRVMKSSDGITWTGLGTDHDFDSMSWTDVTYGNNIFVAVANDGNVMTSSDGINWTVQTAAAANTWNSVIYGNGLFVAVSSLGTSRVMTSPDGVTWTSRTAAEDNSWNAVTYGNGLFVAVASSGTNRVMTSPDGVTWTSRTSTEDNSWKGAIYGNGTFVAVASDGTNRVMTSGKEEINKITHNNVYQGGMSILGPSGILGIGTVSPGALTEIYGTSEQLRISYDGSNYWKDTVASDGGRTLQGIGTDAGLNISTNGDFSVNTDDLYVGSGGGKVGIGTSSPTHLLTVGTSAGGSVCIDNGAGGCNGAGSTAGDIYYNAAHASYADIAEKYPTEDETLEAGEIVSLDLNNKINIKRAEKGEETLGIISTNPGLILGDNYSKAKGQPVALSGRVPVKVNLEGGEINIGDKITLSSVAGVGMKASTSSRTVGIALESFTTEDSQSSNNEKLNQGSILVFVENELTVKSNIETLSSKIDELELRITELENRTTEATETTGGVSVESVLSYMESLGVKMMAGVVEFKNVVTESLSSSQVYTNLFCVDDLCIGRDEFKKILLSADIDLDTLPKQELLDSGSSDVVTQQDGPTITIQGNNPSQIELNSTYVDMGVIAQDSKGNDLSVTVTISARSGTQWSDVAVQEVDDEVIQENITVNQISLDTSTSTTYTITYTTTDNNGATASAEREVIVGNSTTIEQAQEDIATTTPEIIEEETPLETTVVSDDLSLTEQACRADNLESCTTQTTCEEISAYWYNDVCNLEEQIIEETQAEDTETATSTSIIEKYI